MMHESANGSSGPRRDATSSAEKENHVSHQRLEDAAQVAQGSMTQAGLEKIEATKRDGSWSLLDASENLEMPPDLQQALSVNVEAGEFFSRRSNPLRKNILY